MTSLPRGEPHRDWGVVAVALAAWCALASNHVVIAQSRTEVVIVGTVHAPTPQYSIGDLVAILERVGPAVILFEYPAELMTPTFDFRSNDKGSLEQQAVRQYAARTGALIRPFDIDGRNTFYDRSKYFSRESQCNADLNAYIRGQRLSPEAQRIADALRNANEEKSLSRRTWQMTRQVRRSSRMPRRPSARAYFG